MIWDAYKKWHEITPRHEAKRTSVDEKIQFLADKQKLVELVHDYAFGCDARDWDRLAEIYDADIERIMHGTLAEEVRGRENLIDLHRNPRLARAEGVEMDKRDLSKVQGLEIRHLIGTLITRIADDNQRAWALCHYQMALMGNEDGAWISGLHEGTYLFSFSKATGDWKFVQHLIWTNNAANPMFGVPKKKAA